MPQFIAKPVIGGQAGGGGTSDADPNRPLNYRPAAAHPKMHVGPPPDAAPHVIMERPVLFFDIDNTLYSKRAGVEKLMGDAIREYIKQNLHLDDESAEMLHKHYYKDYGLAIEGLVRFNHIDAMDYNAKVDDALPLDQTLRPEPRLRELLESIDKSKVKLWLFTNAYKSHAERVIRLLGLEGIFDGLTYCDYTQSPIICKPKRAMFDRAMKEAGVASPENCYYVDDSVINIKTATKDGWKHTVFFDEFSEHPEKIGHDTISSLFELPKLMPQFFKS